MLFNSFEFLVFIGIFFLLWPFLKPQRNSRHLFLIAASLFFYGWWDWRFIALILFSGLIDFYAALGMVKWPNHRKTCLVLSIIGNVGSLFVFKYLDFTIRNVNWIFSLFGIHVELQDTHLILPVGISFYTFQSMSYTIDVFRGKLTPTHRITHFLAFLSLFPQLVAGPIVRAAHLLPQLDKDITPTPAERWEGTKLIVYGFFKKVVIADTVAPFVNGAFAAATLTASGFYWWVIMLMFSFQIYCDFSGYSDIARGLGKWMGYDFPVNFNHPYIANSIRDFWTRWHISLSTWFRDYLYIPLGGSSLGNLRGQINMWLTMLISGLWHGATWSFVMWGALHASYLSIERLTRWPTRLNKFPLGQHVATLIIFVLALVAWVFFRCGSLHELSAVEQLHRAGQIISYLGDFSQWSYLRGKVLLGNWPLLLLGLIMLRQFCFHLRLDSWYSSSILGKGRINLVTETIFLAMIVVACVYLRGNASAFIYFQF